MDATFWNQRADSGRLMHGFHLKGKWVEGWRFGKCLEEGTDSSTAEAKTEMPEEPSLLMWLWAAWVDEGQGIIRWWETSQEQQLGSGHGLACTSRILNSVLYFLSGREQNWCAVSRGRWWLYSALEILFTFHWKLMLATEDESGGC